MINDQLQNPETSSERRPLLDVERLRVDELCEGVQILIEAGRNEHGIGIAPTLAVEERDMSIYTGIDPSKNPIISGTTPENVTNLSRYAKSIARSGAEQKYDIPKAA